MCHFVFLTCPCIRLHCPYCQCGQTGTVFRTGQIVGSRRSVRPVFQFTHFSDETWSNFFFSLCTSDEYSLPFDIKYSHLTVSSKNSDWIYDI